MVKRTNALYLEETECFLITVDAEKFLIITDLCTLNLTAFLSIVNLLELQINAHLK